MDVVTLGTGSPIPDANRAGAATLVRAAGKALLVDAGRGVVMRLAAAGVFPPMLDQICAGADVYVQTVIRPDLIEGIPSPRLQEILDYHSSCEQAGETAARAGVGTLVLTHPVPPPAPGTEDEWVVRAAAHFDGEIVLAHDLWSITV